MDASRSGQAAHRVRYGNSLGLRGVSNRLVNCEHETSEKHGNETNARVPAGARSQMYEAKNDNVQNRDYSMTPRKASTFVPPVR